MRISIKFNSSEIADILRDEYRRRFGDIPEGHDMEVLSESYSDRYEILITGKMPVINPLPVADAPEAAKESEVTP
jgi:hypothetical protein